MKKNYKSMNGFLVKLDYNFEELKNLTTISIETKDIIRLNEVSDKSINFSVKRNMVFTPFTNTYIKVEFNVTTDLTSPINKETFFEDIKTGLPQLTSIFSKISLVISELTNMSPFGALITSPMYNNKEVLLEE